ncbi:MAG: hypothetical protein EPN93_14255 [Spirochaetes bacterium]|nr:MAG: hypothetical protein EPN93_14255 [Spirochaetota bacterium]
MDLITEHDIDTILEVLSQEAEEPFIHLLKMMRKEQPNIFQYLRDAESDEFNGDERTLLCNVSAVAWYVIKKTTGAGEKVSAHHLDARLEANLELIEDGDREELPDDGDEMSLAGMLADFNEQPMLMTFLVALVTDRPAGYAGNVREEMLPVAVMHVKTIVDSLLLPEKVDDTAEDDEEEETVGEYSDEAFARAREAVEGLYAKFSASSYFRDLDPAQREHARDIVTMFGKVMYEYFLLAPAEWTARRAADCCLEILPGMVECPVSMILPVVASFASFAASSGRVPAAARIADRIGKIGDAH